jgi:branched-chain amino acid transport system substrate-binding protein
MSLHPLPLMRLSLSLLAAACLAGSPSTVGAADAFNIPVILPMTGSAAFLGKEESAALGVAETTVNKAGGISGRPIKFVIQDDQSNPTVALQLATAIVASKVPIMIGSSITASCAAIAPLMKDGPVDICLSPGLHPADGSYVFLPCPSSYDLGVVTSRWLRDRNLKNVAFIYTTDGSGQDGEANMTKALALPENKDLKPVAIEHFGVTDLSVAAQIARIKASNPQAIYVWTTGTPLGTALRAIGDAGIDVPVITSFSNATFDQMTAYKSFMPKNLVFAALRTQASDLMARASLKDPAGVFFSAFKAAGIRPDVGYAIAWDPAMLAVHALKDNGLTATPNKLRAYLASLKNWSGANGTYDFSAVPQRGVADKALVMVRWDPAQENWVSFGK